MIPRVRRPVVFALPLILLGVACDLSVRNLTGRATDEWTRTYQLAGGGEVHVGNTNGLVEIEGVDGSMVDVRAERIARAVTDSAARDLLSRVVIKEDAKPDRVSIETERLGGVMIGASFEVRYHVRMPRSAAVRVETTNGRINLTTLDGSVEARATNGGIVAKELTGGVHARTTNGAVAVDLTSLGRDKIELETTNGAVALTLPSTAKAELSASVTNGAISVVASNFEALEQSRRRVIGRFNGGGTPIALTTTNGAIRVGTR